VRVPPDAKAKSERKKMSFPDIEHGVSVNLQDIIYARIENFDDNVIFDPRNFRNNGVRGPLNNQLFMG